MPPITRKEFAAKVKAKYPDYSDIDDNVLVDKMVAKYPEYKEQISDFSVVAQAPVAEKKNLSQTTSNGSTNGVSPIQSTSNGVGNFNQFGGAIKEAGTFKPDTTQKVSSLEQAHSEDKNWAGNLWNRVVTGTESIMKGASDNVFNAMISVLPESVVGASSEEAKKLYRNEVIPQIGGKATETIKANVTPQEKENFDKGFLSGAIGGLAETLPAMVSPKGTKAAALFMQAYDGALKSINSTEEGAKLPESDKTSFAVVVGGAQAALEKFGLDKIFGKQSTKVATKLAANSIANLVKKSTVPITAEMADQAIMAAAKTLKQKVVNAGGKIATGALVEFGTGSLQEASTILAETITNKATGKEVFEKTSFGDKVKRVATSGAMEAIGGGILGTAAIPFSQTRDYIAEKVATAKTPEDIHNLKQELVDAAPTLTQEQVDTMVATIDNYVRVNSKIPEGTANRKEVAEKIIEREEIESEVSKKKAELENADEAFKPEIQKDIDVLSNRAKEINGEISKVSEVEETKQQNKKEVSNASAQSIEQQQTSGTESGITEHARTEQTRSEGEKPSAESSDSLFGSERGKEKVSEGGEEKTVSETKEYPLDKEWKPLSEGENKGELMYMTPDEFLAKAKELEMTSDDRSRIDKLKKHIQDGKKLDPLEVYSNERNILGSNIDGRHRAVAAKELGIKEVPVIDYTKTQPTVSETKVQGENVAEQKTGREKQSDIDDHELSVLTESVKTKELKVYNILSKRQFAKEFKFEGVPESGPERVKYLKYRNEYLDAVLGKMELSENAGNSDAWHDAYERLETEYENNETEIKNDENYRTKKPATELKTEPTKTEVTVKDGDSVKLPSQIKGGLERTMVFDKGEWKQKVGSELTKVSDKVQQQAQEVFEGKKEIVNEKPTDEVSIPSKESEPTKTEPIENRQATGEGKTSEEGKPKETVSVAFNDKLIGKVDAEIEAAKNDLKAAEDKLAGYKSNTTVAYKEGKAVGTFGQKNSKAQRDKIKIKRDKLTRLEGIRKAIENYRGEGNIKEALKKDLNHIYKMRDAKSAIDYAWDNTEAIEKEIAKEGKASNQPKKQSVLERPKEEVTIDDVLGELLGGGIGESDLANKTLKDKDGGVETYIDAAKKVLKGLYPKAALKAFKTDAEYVAAGGKEGTRGFAKMNKNGEHEILLNLEVISETNSNKTVFHEVIHPIVYDAFGLKPEELTPIWNDLAKKMQDVPGMESVFDHISEYAEHKKAAEGLTEMLTQIAKGNIDLKAVPKSTANQIIELINKVFEAVGLDFKIKNIDDFAEISKKVKAAFETGETKGLEKVVKRGGIDKAVKQLEAADIDPEHRQKLIDLLKQKVESELKAGNITESEAKKIYEKAGIKSHSENIKTKFREQFKAKGVSDEHIDGAIALMDARAKSWASEEKGRTPEQWFDKIADVKSGEFETQNILYQLADDIDLFKGTTSQEAKPFIDKIFGAVKNSEEAKQVYRRLVSKYHPDRNADNKDATEIMQYLNSVKENYDKGIKPQQKVRSSQTDFDSFSKRWEDYDRAERQKQAESERKKQESDRLKAKQEVDEKNKYKQDSLNRQKERVKKEMSLLQKVGAWSIRNFGSAKTTQSIHKVAKEKKVKLDAAYNNKKKEIDTQYTNQLKSIRFSHHGDYVKNKLFQEAAELKTKKLNDVYKWYVDELNTITVVHEIFTGDNIQFQSQLGTAKGALETLKDGRVVIHALEKPDLSTMAHEISHVFEKDLTEAEQAAVKKFGGSEPFARGFERYLRDGNAPTPELKTLFDKFKTWLTDIYSSLKGSPIEKKISPEIKQIFDRLLTEQKQESKAGIKEEKAEPPKTPPSEPKAEGKASGGALNDKAILNRLNEAKGTPEEARKGFAEKGLKYEPSSQKEAEGIAKTVIDEVGMDDALLLAGAGKFKGDTNSLIFAESLGRLAEQESKAKTPEDKLAAAQRYAEVAIEYDEAARDKGRFISSINYFYKKSPLGIKLVEKTRREEAFKDWFKNKDKSAKEFFDEMMKEPEFSDLVKEKVDTELKKERADSRAKRRQKIIDVFDKAKLSKGATYATIIPPDVINGAIEVMKQATLAGESVVHVVGKAVEHISKQMAGKSWDKDKFKKEWEEKLKGIDDEGGKSVPKNSQEKVIERFRKKLKGVDAGQKDKIIRASFKKLVENGALKYEDFKQIIAETLGYGEMTEAESAKLEQLVNDINQVEEIGRKAREEERTPEALQGYKDARTRAEKSATELGQIVYSKPDITNRLLSIMQLNTLGIPSLVNNPIFNIWNQATVRFPIGVQLTAIDQILYHGSKISNRLFGTDVLISENNVFKGQTEFWRKLGTGSKQSTEQLFTGLTNADYFQKEVKTSQIHPFTSAKELWENLKGERPLTKTQKADKAVQATIGIPAEIVARALNIGDKPQRYAAEGAQAAVFAKNLGLQGIDYKYFMEFPKEEAYRKYKSMGLSDATAMKKAEQIQERIIKQGEESTFQQDNLLNDALNAAFKPFGTAGEIVKKFNMPFVKIPLNAFWSVYNLVNPEVAFMQSMVYGAKAFKTKSPLDIQQSKKWFAHGVTGLATMAIAGALAKEGIISPSNDDDTTKKERQGERTYEQQNSIDVNKLRAYLQGKDPNEVKSGLNVDLKWFGNMGQVMNFQAKKLEDMTPEQKENGLEFSESIFENMAPSALDLVQNGVFSNTSSLLTALGKGGQFADSYLLNLMNMATNVVQPAMFAQMSRAQLPYYSKQKADTFYEEVKNNMLSRSSTLRKITGQNPKAAVGAWGDRLDRPDNVMLKLFGISRNNKDNFAQPLYEDYKKTGNTKFLPPAVMPRINGQTLSVKETEQLETLVGQARKNLVAPYVNDMATLSGFNERYSELKEDDKLSALEILYKEGFNVGKDRFIQLYPKYAKEEKSEEEKDDTKERKKFRKSIK